MTTGGGEFARVEVGGGDKNQVEFKLLVCGLSLSSSSDIRMKDCFDRQTAIINKAVREKVREFAENTAKTITDPIYCDQPDCVNRDHIMRRRIAAEIRKLAEEA